MAKPTVHTSVLLPPEVYDNLTALAALLGVPKNTVMVKAIREATAPASNKAGAQ